MATITAKAYIPSAGEYDVLREKFPAFASADVSKKAKGRAVHIDEWGPYTGKGYFFLRTPYGSSNVVYSGIMPGTRACYPTYYRDAGLRVALPLIYKPESSLVRGCREVKRTTTVWDEEKKEDVNVTSTAPVVNYGGNDYIWTNKEDCENGTSKVMSLISLDLIENAVPFDRKKNHNDYAKADELRGQCERVAFENTTAEEKEMVVEVEMSSEDGYEELKYCFPQKQLEIPDVTGKAYIPSAGEHDALKEKFPAFASADVSKKAKEQGASIKTDYHKGYFFLRTPYAGSHLKIYGVYYDGDRGTLFTYSDYFGLRIGLPLIYNPESSLVRGCRKVKRTTKVWDEEKDEEVNVTSTAPVVNYGGNDYIWTNKEDCENGTSKVMSLISLDLIEKAVPFDHCNRGLGHDKQHNDYAKAYELRAQCERVAFENASEEEKAMAVQIALSSEDGYEKLKYCFTQKQLKMLDEIKKFQDDCAHKIENDIKRSQVDCAQEHCNGDESEIQ